MASVVEHPKEFLLLQDVQFRVPMESRRDVDRVKDALDIDGEFPCIMILHLVFREEYCRWKEDECTSTKN